MTSQSLKEVSRSLREELPHIRAEVHRIVHEVFPGLRFTNVWVQPTRSWYGDEVVDLRRHSGRQDASRKSRLEPGLPVAVPRASS